MGGTIHTFDLDSITYTASALAAWAPPPAFPSQPNLDPGGIPGIVPAATRSPQARSVADAPRTSGLRVLVKVVAVGDAGSLALIGYGGAFDTASGGQGKSFPLDATDPATEFFLEPGETLCAIGSGAGVVITVATSIWFGFAPGYDYGKGGC